MGRKIPFVVISVSVSRCAVPFFAQVRLIDAGFVWTEPHSKRIKLKLTIQKEVIWLTAEQGNPFPVKTWQGRW